MQRLFVPSYVGVGGGDVQLYPTVESGLIVIFENDPALRLIWQFSEKLETEIVSTPPASQIVLKNGVLLK